MKFNLDPTKWTRKQLIVVFAPIYLAIFIWNWIVMGVAATLIMWVVLGMIVFSVLHEPFNDVIECDHSCLNRDIDRTV